MKHSRRRFIQQTSLGLIGFTFFSNTFFIYGKSVLYSSNIEEMLIEASNFKKTKEYIKAENIYLSIIQQFPSDNRAYFGLRKIFLVQNKFIKVIRLFEKSVKFNPENPVLLNQLAKEYTSIHLGNSKVVEELNYNFSLVDKAKELYLLAKDYSSNYKSTERLYNDSIVIDNSIVGLNKIDKIIENELEVLDARDNKKAKEILKDNRSKSRLYEAGLSEDLLVSRIIKLKNKSRNNQRDIYIKRTYRELIYKNIKSKNFGDAHRFAGELYTYDKEDIFSLNLYKKSTYRNNSFDTLVLICKENDDFQKTNWSRIGYIKALLKRYEKDNIANLSLIHSLINSFHTLYIKKPSTSLEIYFLEAKFSFLKKDYALMQENIKTISGNLIGTNNTHSLVRFMKIFSNYYMAIGKKDEAIILINSFLSNAVKDYIITEELSNRILAVSQTKSYTIKEFGHQKEIMELKKTIQSV